MSKFKSTSKRSAPDNLPDEWKSINDIPSIEEMIEKIQSDPIFADAFFFQETNNPENAADGTYQPLVDYQGLAFQEFDRNHIEWMQGARGSAKTSTFARWVTAYCLRFPGTRVGLFAPSFRQSKQIFEYCVNYMQANFGVASQIYRLESELVAEPTHGNEPIMKFRNGSFIEPLPSGSGSKLRGRRFNIIGIDEAYNLDREFHVSHVMPMGNVKIGGRPTKIFYLTTSWYSDVYSYTILQSIARNVAKGRPGYGILDIQLGDVLKSGFPFDKQYILHQLEERSDPETGKLDDDGKMTFFNVWIKSGATFFTPTMVRDCQRSDIPVIAKRPEGDETPTVLGVDPATTGEDKCSMSVIGCPGDNERRLRAIYQYKKLMPEEIAGQIHKLTDLHGSKVIVMDKSGSLGLIVAALCARELQFIDGQWQKRQPIMIWSHPEARNARAQIVLTFPSDDRIRLGVMGPRVDSAPQGELDLKNTMLISMKNMFQNGKFFAPKMVKDEDYYDSEIGTIMDEITESLAQFPKIDRKRKPDGKELLVDYRGNFHFTRPAHDDGAFSIIYANYAANIHYRMLEGKLNRDEVPALWGSSAENDMRLQSHKIVLPNL